MGSSARAGRTCCCCKADGQGVAVVLRNDISLVFALFANMIGYLRAGTNGRASAERPFPLLCSVGSTILIGRLTFERGIGLSGELSRDFRGGFPGFSTYDNCSGSQNLTCSVIQKTLGALGCDKLLRKRGDFAGIDIVPSQQ